MTTMPNVRCAEAPNEPPSVANASSADMQPDELPPLDTIDSHHNDCACPPPSQQLTGQAATSTSTPS